MQFVLQAADVKHHNDSIDLDELADTIKIWKNYIDHKPTIEAVFQEFGKHCCRSCSYPYAHTCKFSLSLMTSADPLKPVVLTDEDKSGKIELSELTR